MKRYFIELTALGLMALTVSCHKATGEIDSSVNGSTAEVNLSVDGLRVETSGTRATVIDMPDFSVNGFKIAGYYTSGTPYVDDANPGTSGRFEDNLATATPNVFNYESPTVSTTESVIVPPLVDGKYRVTLSRWVLVDNSYLSYFAWASNVAKGVAEGAAANPIVSSTKHLDLGAPKLTVTSGTTSQSLNVDVVASKSANNQNNVVRTSIDLDFKHIFSKLKFSVKNAAAVNATLTGAKILFTNINRTAIYTFDGTSTSPGTWGTYSNSAAASYAVSPIPSTPLAAAGAAADLGEILIIPQAAAAGAVSVELTYTLPNGAGAASYTRTVPLKASKFEQNNSYNYVITIDESQISIGEGMIGAWKATETGLPNVVGARDANVLLLLDGYDPPYTHTDGTQYWLDRSGWNRHCKILGGVSYNAAGKYYTFLDNPASVSYCEVPAFPTTSAATVEVITRSNRPTSETSASQNVFAFNSGDERYMFTHFNYNGGENYYFDAGGAFNRVTSTIPLSLYREFAMYSFSRGSGQQSFRRNLVYVNNAITMGSAGGVDLSKATGRQIGTSYKGDIRYFKVSATAKTSINSTEYANLSKRHKIKNTDYVDEGLQFDLRGTDAPTDNKWFERANGIYSNVSPSIYSAVNREYTPVGSDDAAMIFFVPSSLRKTYENMTFNVVLRRPAGTGAYNEVELASNDTWSAGGNADNYYMLLFRPKSVSENCMIVYTNMRVSWGADAGPRWNYPGGADGYQTTKRSYTTIRSNNNRLDLYSGNEKMATESYTGNPLRTVDFIRLGRQKGASFSAARLYDRVLSASELTWNYNIDKILYGLP